MSLFLAQEVINNAFGDLTDYLGHGSSSMHSKKLSPLVVGETIQQNFRRKRKRASVMPLECPNGSGVSIKTANKNPQTPFSLQIAALKALEALITMGGSLRSEQWRSDVDCIVATVATNACDAGWAKETKISSAADESSSLADFQLATLQVLLTSLLSPTQGRPPYLSKGFDLFHRGRHETGTKLATFCATALLCLEVLIHPRALPPQNPSFNDGFHNKIGGITLNNGIKSNLTRFSEGLELLDEDEELCKSWFDKNDEQASVEVKNLNDKQTEITKESSNDIEVLLENPSTSNAGINPVPECEKPSQNVDVGRTEIVLNNVSDSMLNMVRESSQPSDTQKLPCKSSILLCPDLEEDAGTKQDSYSNKIEVAKLSYDSDSNSMDSLPDIVCADPDSDYSV